MQTNLQAVWHEVENLLTQQISIIPVRDRDDFYNGKTYAAKTPYKKWEQYQHEIIDRGELWNQMQERNTTAIAMVCGAISGNLEVLDFDVKYKPGIDAIVIAAMRELYPDIFAKLRMHRTPSGGAHLVYRIADHEVPASMHLANRPATEEEIQLSPKSKKYRCFIETRGTGALCTAPPSLGYTLVHNVQIQTITWEERCSIVEFCRAYNEYLPEQKPYLPPKTEQNYYDENPFEHYNRAVDPKELFEQFGWTYVKQHGDYIWFTRPGGKRGEVHAGFNLNTRTYRVWGTKADLESDRSYTPSTILAHYRFNDDKSLTYAHLVQQGYGRIKPHIERNIANRQARRNQPMPANVSPQAVEQYNTLVVQYSTTLPHGTYWQTDDNDKVEISFVDFYDVAAKLGWRLYKDTELVQVTDGFIYKKTTREFEDALQQYIYDEDPDVYKDICNTYEKFLRQNSTFVRTRIKLLEDQLIIKDQPDCCYKFYANGFVKITKDGYDLYDYNTLPEGSLVWHEKIQQRDFVLNNTHAGLYITFLQLACNLDANKDHIMRVLGWLAHDYKDTTTGYIIMLTEQCADPKDGGGSGKNLFCDLLKGTTTCRTIPAAKKLDQTNLLQAWRGEKILVLSDPKKDFDIEMLKEPAAGSAIDKKLFKDEKPLEAMDVPKFVIPTNFSYDITDGGLRRRIIAVEFTNFFTECGGVDAHFSRKFPDDWQAEDWTGYDNFICASVCTWLCAGLKLKPIELQGTGWDKQFQFVYGPIVTEFIKENWEHFKEVGYISNEAFNQLLDKFLIENNYNPHKFKPTAFKMNKALEEWCKRHDWFFEKNETVKVNFSTERGRKFYFDAPF